MQTIVMLWVVFLFPVIAGVVIVVVFLLCDENKNDQGALSDRWRKRMDRFKDEDPVDERR